MNASEIEYLEARLPVGSSTMPSPEQLQSLVAKVRHERNQEMAASFSRFISGFLEFTGEVRRIAVACTAARLHRQNV